VLLETFIRKQLRRKAHTVTKVEETDEFMVVSIDRLGKRLLVQGMRAATPGGPQCEKGGGLARPVASEVALETALPPW